MISEAILGISLQKADFGCNRALFALLEWMRGKALEIIQLALSKNAKSPISQLDEFALKTFHDSLAI